MASSEQPDFYAELDQRLVAATRGIRLLATVSWPASIELEFIAAWKRGAATLPEISYAHADFSATRETLAEITLSADPAHPIGDGA